MEYNQERGIPPPLNPLMQDDENRFYKLIGKILERALKKCTFLTEMSFKPPPLLL